MKRAMFILIVIQLSLVTMAQSQKNKLAILSLDDRLSSGINREDYTSMAYIELEKLGIYDMIDQYDVKYKLGNDKGNTADCYGKICLVTTGKFIGADKMFTGALESFKDRIVITLKIIDVDSATVEKSQITEFYYYPQEIQRMLEMAIKKMHGVSVDDQLLAQIAKPDGQSNMLNIPIVDRLKLNGPRLGYAFFTGELARRMNESKGEGGFDAYPAMFQFGYQFETQYVNEGNLQALFEFIPLITGVDQGYVIPSLTILHGLRNNRTGWEFAVGPSIQGISESEGYYDADNKWRIDLENANGLEIVKRLDSRGTLTLKTGFVVAVGKTFRSGRLNIPMNAYFIPGRDGFRYGFSFGFNATKKN